MTVGPSARFAPPLSEDAGFARRRVCDGLRLCPRAVVSSGTVRFVPPVPEGSGIARRDALVSAAVRRQRFPPVRVALCSAGSRRSRFPLARRAVVRLCPKAQVSPSAVALRSADIRGRRFPLARCVLFPKHPKARGSLDALRWFPPSSEDVGFFQHGCASFRQHPRTLVSLGALRCLPPFSEDRGVLQRGLPRFPPLSEDSGFFLSGDLLARGPGSVRLLPSDRGWKDGGPSTPRSWPKPPPSPFPLRPGKPVLRVPCERDRAREYIRPKTDDSNDLGASASAAGQGPKTKASCHMGILPQRAPEGVLRNHTSISPKGRAIVQRPKGQYTSHRSHPRCGPRTAPWWTARR
jgi:hypothetical protein